MLLIIFAVVLIVKRAATRATEHAYTKVVNALPEIEIMKILCLHLITCMWSIK